MSNIAHKGLHRYRFQDNPEEQRFASRWERENSQEQLLEWLLGRGNRRVPISDREAQVAATVIQWLGSPVGQVFLLELGYVKGGK